MRVSHHASLAQHRDFIRECRHFMELVGDHQHGQLIAPCEVAHQAQHFLCFLLRQYRGRLVQDQETPFQVELFEDFQFLLLARGETADHAVERKPERHRFHEGLQFGLLPFP